MSIGSKPNQSPQYQCEWDPEDLEWLAQQVKQSAPEEGGDGGVVPAPGASPDKPKASSQATPPPCGEEHAETLKLPTIRKENGGESDASATAPEKRPLLNGLLVSQLAASLPQWLSQPERADDAIELYQKSEPQNAIETVLSALTVGLFNASMGGLDRAATPGLRPEVRQMELKLGFIEAVAVRENRRALSEDSERREDMLNELMHRYGLAPTKQE